MKIVQFLVCVMDTKNELLTELIEDQTSKQGGFRLTLTLNAEHSAHKNSSWISETYRVKQPYFLNGQRRFSLLLFGIRLWTLKQN